MPVRNRRISFLHKRSETDEIGQLSEVWEDTGKTALAEISGISGKLYYEAARNHDEETVLFVFRYSSWMSDLNKIDYRISYGGRVYEIKHITDVKEKHRDIQARGISIDV